MATSGPENETIGLFHGARFWLSQNIPQRASLKDMIAQNGGHVVLLEKDADVKLVDHLRKNLPPNTFSYRYVELSVRNGRLEDLEAHRIGPSAPRPMGASHIPKKGTRTDYSLQEDQILFDWLYPFEQMPDSPISGNRIYQMLAEKFPQHTWQSWRSRYIRHLRGNPRPGGGTPRPDLLHSTFQVEPQRLPPTRVTAPAVQPKHTEASLPQHGILREEPQRQPPPRVTATAVHSIGPETSLPRPSPSVDPNSKRKRDPSTQVSSLRVDGAVPSPSKKQKTIEAREPAVTVARDLRREDPSLAPQPSNIATPTQTIHPTQEPTRTIQPTQDSSSTTIQPTQLPDETQPTLEWATEPTNNAQEQVDLFLELPYPPSSPEPDDGEESDESDLPDVDGWIDAQLARGKADESTIIAALHSASMDQELAGQALEHWDPTKGLPDDMPGIWSTEDDKCLEGEDARAIQRVLTKHGQDASNTRWEYLRMARERGVR